MAAAAIATPRLLYGGPNQYTTDFHMDTLAASSASPSSWSWTFVYRMAGTWMQILARNSELEGTQQILTVQPNSIQAAGSQESMNDSKENEFIVVQPGLPSVPVSLLFEEEASYIPVKDVVLNAQVQEEYAVVPTVPESPPSITTPDVALAAEEEVEVPVQTQQNFSVTSCSKRKHSDVQEPATRRRPNHISFNETVMVVATFSTKEYNREGVAKTVFTSRKELEKFMREMAMFKCYEMEVHPDSRENTHFYRQVTEVNEDE
eukprot:comp23168_c0_seq1/m.37508 comp23168_c0_seq1/g.37508  ORF comp23168_c0_seq1/g.37508 comp23168_c0_seq1/m.37508 type:complete len:262 (-) comp23168_c0_seq1:887-1672(-)